MPSNTKAPPHLTRPATTAQFYKQDALPAPNPSRPGQVGWRAPVGLEPGDPLSVKLRRRGRSGRVCLSPV